MSATKTSGVKRKKTHPNMVKKKTRIEPPRGVWYLEFRRRIETILERTAAARREIDARAAGADISALADLPVVTFPAGRPPKPPGLQKLMRQLDGDTEGRASMSAERPDAPPMAPPVPYNRNELMATRSKGKRTRTATSEAARAA